MACRILASVCFSLSCDVDFVVAAGLVRHVALAGVVVHRGLQRLDPAGAENLGALLEKRPLNSAGPCMVHSCPVVSTFGPVEHQIICTSRESCASPGAHPSGPNQRSHRGHRVTNARRTAAANSLGVWQRALWTRCSVDSVVRPVARWRRDSDERRYSARSVASGLFRSTSRLETDADEGHQDGGEHDAADVLAGEHAPGDFEGVAADAPGQHHRAERADQPGERSEHAVSRTAASARSSGCWRPSVLNTAAS